MAAPPLALPGEESARPAAAAEGEEKDKENRHDTEVSWRFCNSGQASAWTQRGPVKIYAQNYLQTPAE